MTVPPGYTHADHAKLMSLSGDQTCECCGAEELPAANVDVVDHEVVCIDCVATYHPKVYEQRAE